MKRKEGVVPFTMPLPIDLRNRLDERASRNRRSRTQEILAMIEERLTEENQTARPSEAGAPAVGNTSQV